MGSGDRVRLVVEVDAASGEASIKRLVGDVDKLDKSAGKASGSLGGLGAAVHGIGGRLAGFGDAIVRINQGFDLMGRAVSALGGGFDAAFGRILRNGDELLSISRRLQIGVDTLQGFKYAAAQAGVSLEEVGASSRFLGRALVESSKAGSDAQKVLVDQLKFTKAQLEGFKGNPTEAIVQIAARFNDFRDGAEKAAAAQVLFGRGFQSFLGLAAEGEGTLRRNITLGKRFAESFGTDAVEAADRLGDAIASLQSGFASLADRVLANPRAMNALGSAVEHVTIAMLDLRDRIPADALDGFAQLVEQATPKVLSFVDAIDIKRAADAFSSGLSAGAQSLRELGSAISSVIQTASAVNGMSPLAKAAFAWAIGGPGLAAAYAGAVVVDSMVNDPGRGAAAAKQYTADAEARARAAQDPEATRYGLFGAQGADYSKSLAQQNIARRNAGLPPLPFVPENATRPTAPRPGPLDYSNAPAQGPGTDAGLGEALRNLGSLTSGAAGARDGLGRGLGGGGGGKKGGSGGAEDSFAEKIAKLRDEIEKLKVPTQEAVVEQAAETRELEKLQAKAGDATVNVRELVAEKYRLAAAAKDVATQQKFETGTLVGLRDSVAVLRGEMSETDAKLREFGRGLPDGITAAQRAEALALKQNETMLERSSGAYVNFFDLVTKGWTDVSEALVLGTRPVGEAFKGLGTSIVSSLVGAFAEGFKAKLGFESGVKTNVVSFMSDLGNILAGRGANSGGGIAGILTDVTTTVLGGGTTTALAGTGATGAASASGGTGILGSLGSLVSGGSSLGGGSLGGLASAFSGTAGTLGLLTLGLGAAQSGGGFKLTPLSGGLLGLSAIRTIAPYLAATGLGSRAVAALGNGQTSQLIQGLLGLGGAGVGGAGAGLAAGLYGGVGPLLSLAQPAVSAAFAPTVTAAGASVFGGSSSGVGPLLSFGAAPATDASLAGLGTTAANTGGSIAAGLSSLISIVGSLYSLYSSVTGAIANQKGFKAATFNDRNAGQNFAAFQTTGLAIGAGVGAGVGAAVGASAGTAAFPGIGTGIGTVVGALAGAAIGAALAQALASTVAGAVGKGVKGGLGKGLSQEELYQSVKSDTLLRIVNGVLSVGYSETSGGNNMLSRFFLGGLVPDIDDIFDKILIKRINKGANVDFSRRPTVLGQGVTAEQFQTTKGELPEIREVAFLLNRLTGAGTGVGFERIRRTVALLFNNIAGMAKDADAADALLYRVVRGVFGNRLLPAIRSDLRTGGYDRDVIARAFGRALPGVVDDQLLYDTGKAILDQPGKIKRPDVKASRELIGQNLGAFLDQPGAFAQAAGGKLNEALQEKLGSALIQPVLGDAFAGLFSTIRRSGRRLARRGFGADAQADFQAELGVATDNAAKAIGALVPAIPALKAAFDVGLQFSIKFAEATGDYAALTSALEQAAGPLLQTARAYVELGSSVRDRVEALGAVGTFGANEAQINAQRRAQTRAGSKIASLFGAGPDRVTSFLAGLGNGLPTETALQLQSYFGTGTGDRALATKILGTDPRVAYDALKEYATARLDLLSSELDLARQQKTAFEGVRDTFQAFSDQLQTIQRGPAAGFEIFKRKRGEAEGLLGSLTGADGKLDFAKAAKLEKLLPELLQLGQGLFAPGSAELSSLFSFLGLGSGTLTQLGAEGAAAAATREADVKAQVDAFGTAFEPLISYFGEKAANGANAQFDRVVKALVGADESSSLRDAIQSVRLAIDPTGGVDATPGRVPTANARLRSGTTAEAAGRDVTLTVNMTVGIGEGLQGEAVLKSVADGLRKRIVPEAIRTIREELGA